MRDVYNQQLEQLHTQMVRMGGLCEKAIASSVKMLTEEEAKAEVLQAQVLEMDGEIDEQEREIENLCTKLLLKQQPVATDLRRITAALKMITDLERIGDHATNLAEWVEYAITGMRSKDGAFPQVERR